MADTRIGQSEIFSNDIFDGFIKDAESSLASLKALESQYQSLLKTSKARISVINPNSLKEIQSLNKEISSAQSLTKQYDTIQKNITKTEAQLESVRSQQNKTLLENRENLKEQTKEIRNQIRVQKTLGVEYENITDLVEKLADEQLREVSTKSEAVEQNKALQIIVSQLNPAIEEQATLLEDLNKRIDDNNDFLNNNSDSLTQQRNQIGDYSGGIQDAIASSSDFGDEQQKLNKIISDLSGAYENAQEKIKDYRNADAETRAGVGKSIRRFAILGAGLAVLGSAFATSRERQIEFRIFLRQLETGIISLIGRLGQFSNGLIELFSSLNIGNRISILTTQFKLFVAELAESIDIIPDSIKGFIGLESTTNNTSDSVENLRQRLSDLRDQTPSTSSAIDKITSSFDGFIEGLTNASEATRDLVEAELELELAERKALETSARLEAERARLSEIAGDDTRSLKEQLSATEELSLATQRGITAEIALVRQRLDINKQEQALRASNGFDQTNETLLQEAELNAEIIRLEGERVSETLAIQVERNKREREIFEQNLDFLEDVTERNRNLLRRQFEDTSQNVDDRLSAFSRLREGLSSDLQAQAEEFNSINEDLGLDITYDPDTGAISAFVGDTRLSTDNVKELNSQLQDLGTLDEIEINRLRGVIIAGQDASQEIAELNKQFERLRDITQVELSDSLALAQEELNEIKDITAQISNLLAEALNPDLTEEQANKINERIEDLQKQREDIENNANDRSIKNRIEAIDRELEAVEKNSTDALELQRERAELELELQDEINDRKLKQAEEAANDRIKTSEDEEEARAKLIEEANELAENAAEKFIEFSKKRQEALGEEIDAQKDSIDDFRELANAGNTDAQDNLANQQQRLAELERERLKEASRQQAIEVLLATFKTFSAELENSDNPLEAGANTIGILTRVVSFANGLISSLPSFYDGTGDNLTPNVGAGIDGIGGFHAILHPDEMVINARDTKKMGKGITTNEVVSAVVGSRSIKDNPAKQKSSNDNVVKEIKALRKDIVNINASVEREYNEVEDIITRVVTRGTNKKRIRKKVRRANY